MNLRAERNRLRRRDAKYARKRGGMRTQSRKQFEDQENSRLKRKLGYPSGDHREDPDTATGRLPEREKAARAESLSHAK